MGTWRWVRKACWGSIVLMTSTQPEPQCRTHQRLGCCNTEGLVRSKHFYFQTQESVMLRMEGYLLDHWACAENSLADLVKRLNRDLIWVLCVLPSMGSFFFHTVESDTLNVFICSIIQRHIRAAVEQHLLDLQTSIDKELGSYESQVLDSQPFQGWVWQYTQRMLTLNLVFICL